MRTRFTTYSDEDGYVVRDLFAKAGDKPRGFRTMNDAKVAAKDLNREWVLDLQECKDELFRADLLNRSENENIQSKLDAAKGEVWTKNRAWRGRKS